jgi:WD40 repeat protein
MCRLLLVIYILFSASLWSIRVWAQDDLGNPYHLMHEIISIAWTHDGSAVAAGRVDGIVEIYSSDGVLKTIFHAADGSIENFDWSHDDRQLASAGDDRRFRIWTPNGRLLYISDVMGSPILALAWNPTDESLLVGPLSDPISVWKIDTTLNSYTLTSQHEIDGTSEEILYDPTGSLVAFAQSYGEVLVYDVNSWVKRASFGSVVEGDDLRTSIWNPSGKSIAVAFRRGHIVGWTLEGERLYDLSANRGEEAGRFYGYVLDLWFNTDGTQLTAVSLDGTIRVWDMITLEVIGEGKLPDPVFAASISPDGTKIAYASVDSIVIIDELSALLEPVP